MSLPERIGRYRILGFLASGGMAEILLAKLLGPGGFERAVVVKRVLPHLARQSEFREMFLDEARIVARIQHPNVVQVSELGQEGRELFMVMEYLAGESLGGLMRRVTAREEPLEPAIAAYVVAEAAAGLHAAHDLKDEHGVALDVVHRDVSPQNIFLTYDGSVKVLDFGIAKFMDRSVETHTGQLKGKFAYMSPEQCCAERLDRRSDVFSLGILLWELLTGRRLFQRANELLVWKAIVEDAIPTPSERRAEGAPPIPPALEAVAMRALARKKDDRYASANDLRRDLLAALRDLDPEHRGADRLAPLMRALFPDRIAQKDEMLRRVHAGDVITSVPSAEVDIVLATFEHLPTDGSGIVVEELAPRTSQAPPFATADTDPHPISPSTAPPRVEPSWRALLFGGLLLGAVVIGAVLGVGWDRGADAAAPSVDALQIAAPPTQVVQPRPEQQPRVREEPGRVVRVRVETAPAGASVRLGGEERGITPIDLELPRGTDTVPVSIVLEGYREVIEPIVPDVDQRVRLTLERERRRPTTTRPTKTGAGGTGTEGGGFFRFE